MRGSIYVGMIAWDIEALISESCSALIKATEKLSKAGYTCRVKILDNASEDKTYSRACAMFPELVRSRREPESSSRLRNYLLQEARGEGHDYLILVDGDIVVEPSALLHLMESLDAQAGLTGVAGEPEVCVVSGAFPTPQSVTRYTREALMYVCGVGAFRLPHLVGMKFEEGGPFNHPGWGCEDDDWYFQLRARGLDVAYINTALYQHPTRHSSWAPLRKLGIDPKQSFEERRGYLLTKWQGYHSLGPYLHLLEGVHA